MPLWADSRPFGRKVQTTFRGEFWRGPDPRRPAQALRQHQSQAIEQHPLCAIGLGHAAGSHLASGRRRQDDGPERGTGSGQPSRLPATSPKRQGGPARRHQKGRRLMGTGEMEPEQEDLLPAGWALPAQAWRGTMGTPKVGLIPGAWSRRESA